MYCMHECHINFQLQIVFLGSGYFLLVGTIVAKLWRIYYIFR